jgi:hypothetical protein
MEKEFENFDGTPFPKWRTIRQKLEKIDNLIFKSLFIE